jgi:hypothetical protein
VTEWYRELQGPYDAEALAGAVWAALADASPPAPLPYESASEAGITERWSGPSGTGLRVRETWEWRMTRDDDQLQCAARAWDATVPGGSFTFEWWSGWGRLWVRADEPTLRRVREAVWAALGMSEDELDVLDVLAKSAAFAIDIFGNAHRRLEHLRYTPMRLEWVRVGEDDTATLAALDRIAARRPDLAGPAALAAATLLGLSGRRELALARLEAAPSTLDLALCRANVLSWLGRHEEAIAALRDVPTNDPLAHSARALAVAIYRRAGRPAEAAAAARSLSAASPGPVIWGVLPAHALAVAAVLAQDAGDEAGLRGALDADGPGIAQVAELAARGMSRNAQWFLLANATPARLAALTAR